MTRKKARHCQLGKSRLTLRSFGGHVSACSLPPRFEKEGVTIHVGKPARGHKVRCLLFLLISSFCLRRPTLSLLPSLPVEQL